MLLEAVELALRAIARNGLRSFLTVLGIIIGVAAVIAMVTIGRGTTVQVGADLAKLGTNLLVLVPGQWGPGRSSLQAKAFQSRDVEAIQAQVGGVRAVAPIAQSAVSVVYGSESRSVPVTGTDNAYLTTQGWRLAAGRAFLDGELRAGRAVCMLGRTVREKLFGARDAVGQTVRVKNFACEVIAELESKGASGMGIDQDDTVLMPIRAFQRRISGNVDVARIHVSAQDGVDTAKLQRDLERLLRERRNITAGEDDDFSVRDLREITQATLGTTALLTQLLGAVSAVSLLVGGIGIMNIMLVSVTERTREIGIRLAIGALEGQVLLQFLVEAVVLSVAGGLLGVALGLALAGGVTRGLGVPFVPEPRTALLAFAVSALIGVVFGFFPARHAARLDPIEALRRE